MSLAEKMPANVTAEPAVPVQASRIDNILRLALAGGGQRAAAPPKPADPDFNAAVDLLDRATSAIRMLTERQHELEQAVLASEEQVRDAEDKAAEWERCAMVIKSQLQDCESQLSEQQIKIDALTYRAENSEARALLAEQTAAEARRQSQMYHDKIVTTFGSLALTAP